MSTQISYSFTATDSFSENSKFTNLYVFPSFALSIKKYKMNHCVFTHLLWWFCTMSIYPSWNYISPNSHPVWLLVKKGVTRKICTRFRRQKWGEYPEGCYKAPGAVAVYTCGHQSACSWGCLTYHFQKWKNIKTVRIFLVTFLRSIQKVNLCESATICCQY